MKKVRILIVEDEVRLAETLRDLLELEHYTADISHDGESGLDNALSDIYDLVILDVMTSTRRYRKALGFDICYQEIEKNLGKMYDPVIGRFVLDNWDKVITVLQKDENSPEVLIQ